MPYGAKKLLCTVVAPLLPSSSTPLDVTRISCLAILITTFFLFTGMYYVPGGASQFTDWAQAIVHGTKLAPTVAQRDVGYPLMLLLSGYTISGSLIGITLLQATFAILMPLLSYASVKPFSQGAAYYVAQITNLSLVPILFMKMIHHDQTYLFFMMLMLAWLIVFITSHRYSYLYLFSLAALLASVSGRREIC